MNCPACGKPMIVLELDQVEVDYCTRCQGVWLDGGELELLLEDSIQRDDFLSSFTTNQHSQETPKKCPICSRRMEKILVGKEGRVCIDRCRQGDGIWLDGGELEQILSLNSFGKNHRVLRLLKDIFYKRA